MNRSTATKGAVGRREAQHWASWFQALSDPTRILILHALACSPDAMTVGEITATVDVGQSTISHHLAKLETVGFVQVERSGTSSRWSLNQCCVEAFPRAAHIIVDLAVPGSTPPERAAP